MQTETWWKDDVRKKTSGSDKLVFLLRLVYWIMQWLPFWFFFLIYSRQHCLTDHTCTCNFMGHTPLIFIRLIVPSIGSRAGDCHAENWCPSIAFQQSNNLLDLGIQQVIDFFFSIKSLVQAENTDCSYQNVILTSICPTDHRMQRHWDNKRWKSYSLEWGWEAYCCLYSRIYVRLYYFMYFENVYSQLVKVSSYHKETSCTWSWKEAFLAAGITG